MMTYIMPQLFVSIFFLFQSDIGTAGKDLLPEMKKVPEGSGSCFVNTRSFEKVDVSYRIVCASILSAL